MYSRTGAVAAAAGDRICGWQRINGNNSAAGHIAREDVAAMVAATV